MTFNYSWAGGCNDGKLVSQTDSRSPRPVSYQYDILGRLRSATATAGWSQVYFFDGFGPRAGEGDRRARYSVRCDKGSEFTSSKFLKWAEERPTPR